MPRGRAVSQRKLQSGLVPGALVGACGLAAWHAAPGASFVAPALRQAPTASSELAPTGLEPAAVGAAGGTRATWAAGVSVLPLLGTAGVHLAKRTRVARRATLEKTGAQAVKELRERSRAGILDCQKALKESEGDMDKAMDWLKKRGIAKADKKLGNAAVEGNIASYVHFNNKIGVIVEVNSETDFVASNEIFQELTADIAMQIAANPAVQSVTADDVPQHVKDKAKEEEMTKEDLNGKPDDIKEKIVAGRLKKRFEESALMSQKWLKDEDKTVQDVLKERIAKLGENLVVRRFARMNLGEGLEKKEADFAAGVEAELAKYRADPSGAPDAAPNAAPNVAANAAPDAAPNAAPNVAANAAPDAAPEEPALRSLLLQGLEVSTSTPQEKPQPSAPAEKPKEAKAEKPKEAKAEKPKEAKAEAPKASVAVPAALVKELRERSKAGILDAKKALAESDLDMEKAMAWLKKKGMAKADKKAGNLSVEGTIASYVHFNKKIGVMVEINCETDFVAINAIFQEFAANVAMQIAANPSVECVSTAEVPQEIKDKERAVEMGKDDLNGKPEEIKAKIVDGRLSKRFEDMALLNQKWLMDEDKTVQEALKEQIAKLGENIVIRRFSRLTLGEGLEKKDADFAAGVEAELAKYRA